jgi:hypothetical protein
MVVLVSGQIRSAVNASPLFDSPNAGTFKESIRMSDAPQVRMNELARHLEVKAKVIIDLLPSFGVTERKTHSSLITAEVAEKVCQHLNGQFNENLIYRPPVPLRATPAVPKQHTECRKSVEGDQRKAEGMKPLINWNNKTVQAIAAALIVFGLWYFAATSDRDPLLDDCDATANCKHELP